MDGLRVSNEASDKDITLDLAGFNLTNLRIFDRVDKCTFTDAQIRGAQLGPVDVGEYIRRDDKTKWLPLGMSKEQLYSTYNYKIGTVNNITFRYSDFADATFNLITHVTHFWSTFRQVIVLPLKT